MKLSPGVSCRSQGNPDWGKIKESGLTGLIDLPWLQRTTEGKLHFQHRHPQQKFYSLRTEPDYIFEKNATLFQQGNEQALAFFFSQFHPALSHYAFGLLHDRSLSEEIATSAFVKTWKMHGKLDRFEGIRAYLYKVVQRDCLRAIKNEKKRSAVHLAAPMPMYTDDTPFDQLVKTELYRLLHGELKKLSPGNQKVLAMHYFEGKTTAEIAAELKLSDSTIKTHKIRALAALRKKLNTHHPFIIIPFLKIFFQLL